MRKRATGPMYAGIREVESWFKPLLDTLQQVERHLKGGISSYRVALEKTERAAREAAAVAAETGDSTALVAALEASTAAAAPPPGRATARMVWEPTAADAKLVPREYMTVDWSALKIAGKNAGDGPAPEIAGVAFERRAIVGARR
jgi:hypothetical protein